MVQVVDYAATLPQDQGPDLHRAQFSLLGLKMEYTERCILASWGPTETTEHSRKE